MDNAKIDIADAQMEIKPTLKEAGNQEFDFGKIQEGKYAETFLKFLAEKYQESYDGSMRELLENDKYLSNDEIELIIEKHLDKNDKNLLEKSLQQLAQNKFDNLEKLAFFPNFVESIPLLTEGMTQFMEQINLKRESNKTSESTSISEVEGKQSNIKIRHLNTFFENAPITKKGLDGLIQLHSQNPQRLINAIEEQFFPHILLPNDDKKAITEGVKQYIKTMSGVIQSGVILMDKSKNSFTYFDKVDVLENNKGQVTKSDSVEDLATKIAKKGKGITVYQDHHIMYALLKNFGKNFNQSFQNTQFERENKPDNLNSIEYEMRKLAVNAFVQKLEKVIGKQAGIESLKAQKNDIIQGKYSDMILINDVEAKFYLIKKDDKYFVSLIPNYSPDKKKQFAQKNKPEIKVGQKKIRVSNPIKIKH
jgi:hypothetical protein